jgi:hypothetical protein
MLLFRIPRSRLMLARPLLAAKAGCRAVLRNNPETKAMSTVYERISSQIANELESGARSRLKPWNAEYAAGWITHPLRGASRADVIGVSHATA